MIGGTSGMMIAAVMALGMNFVSYWFSDSIVLKMYGARAVDSGKVYDLTRELVQRANMPMPRVYEMDTDQPNAFATGRNPHHAAVAVTRGLMNILDEREVRAVIAHELAHIRNRDTLIMTVTATIAGALGMLANYAMFFGSSHQDEEGNHQGGGIVASLAIMILAPMAASIVQMAISRTREYAADKIGAEIAHDPIALASALAKIDHAAHHRAHHVAERNPATAHMFIINPLHLHSIDGLFSTHPKTEHRIAALQKLAQQMGREESFSHASPFDAPKFDAPKNTGPWG